MTIIQTSGLEDEKGLCNFMAVHMQQYPFIFSDERRYRVRRHIIFWTAWWLFQGFLYSFIATSSAEYMRRLPSALLEALVFLVPHMFMAYSLMYFVIPRYVLKQKYWITAIAVVLIWIITGLISGLLALTVIYEIRSWMQGSRSSYAGRPIGVMVFLSLMAGLRGGITIGGVAAAIKLMKYWYVKEQRNMQLQKENVESQLQLLKAQVHPHFLFNTLNNIYSHTQNTAPVAARLVAGLSDMLRYILYESNQPLVTLQKELKMIQDYINLENIRYGNKLDLHIDIPEKSNDLYIAPLLLLPLIENSFKHGTSDMLEQPWISFQVALDENRMQVKLMNGKAGREAEKQSSSGIGIGNVEKRLALLYPGKHTFTITNDEDVFIINFTIELEKDRSAGIKIINPGEIKDHV